MEIRQSGSEAGAAQTNAPSLPLSIGATSRETSGVTFGATARAMSAVTSRRHIYSIAGIRGMTDRFYMEDTGGLPAR